MAEKVKVLNLERDFKKFLYWIDGSGNVAAKQKKGDGPTVILVADAVTREKGYLYFLDKEGDVARSPMDAKKKQADESPSV
jgi:hypothetical protein